MTDETKIQTLDNPVWHAMPADQVLQKLGTDKQEGLAQTQVAKLAQEYGKNTLPRGKKTSAATILLRQFMSPLVYILLIAASLTFWLHEYVDMAVILLVVLVNAMIGYYQEYRANQIFEKLKAIVRVQALVLRSGKTYTVDAEELVPGDIIWLKNGSKVPADGRLFHISNIETNEALLTGESAPVAKSLEAVQAKSIIGDRKNMVFMGTVVEKGEGMAVVTATGQMTEIGHITLLTQSTNNEESPLQARIKKLGNFLSEVFVAISLAIFAVGLARGFALTEMIKTTIAVAVAAIPEGLPAAISVILAVSSQKILNRKGLVRRLVAAETLGSTSVICTDKTGTLTYGEMRLEQLDAENQETALEILALANEAVIEEKDGHQIINGEATDKAKLQKFMQSGKSLPQLLRTKPRVGFLPFDSDYKMLASFHTVGAEQNLVAAYVSGAPETIITKSNLEPARQEQLQGRYETLAASGYRVIGLAYKNLDQPLNTLDQRPEKLIEILQGMDFIGLAAIRDPIREDVVATLKVTRQAGIKVLMITGDHILTAKAIGTELGFDSQSKSIISGEELDKLSSEELSDRISYLEIIARATPAHKMRIIAAWQKKDAVVAMTGDGVNDAPALKAANIGVAIGSGTDVSKEASDLVLLDDSFSTITAAVAEGRTGFANIRKATLVVLSNAFTELILITISIILGTPFPITAVQILWVNLVTDALPVLSLAFDPSERGIMDQKPISPREPILNREIKTIIFAVGIISDLLLSGVFLYLFHKGLWPLEKLQTFIFMATAIPTLFNIFAFKSLRDPITKINILNNRLLIFSVFVGIGLMLLAVYNPLLSKFLNTQALPVSALLMVMVFVALKFILIEAVKWRFRKT